MVGFFVTVLFIEKNKNTLVCNLSSNVPEYRLHKSLNRQPSPWRSEQVCCWQVVRFCVDRLLSRKQAGCKQVVSVVFKAVMQ